MDYGKKYLNRTGFKSGSGILASAPWYRGTTGPSQILKAPRGYTGMQEILAGGILGTGASKFLEDEDKENLPVETEETKLPKKEPPEGEPDLLPELTKQTVEEVIRKEIKEKEPLNKIQTWEHVTDTKEEFKKLAEENKMSFEELEKGAVQSQVKFRKEGQDFGVYFNKKKIAELLNITSSVREYALENVEDESSGRSKNINTYNLMYLESDGYFNNGVETFDGIENAKNTTKLMIANDLMNMDESDVDVGWISLRKIFQKLEYNKKGLPAEAERARETITKQMEKHKEKKAMGGLIDKPLPGGSRYI